MNIHLFFFLLSINLYFFAPIQYSQTYISIVTILFITQSFYFVKKVSKGNYLNFYTLFFISYYFINYFYPSVLYPIDPEYFPFFRNAFDYDIINRATALAYVASTSLIYGSSLVRFKKNKRVIKSKFIFNHLPVTILSSLLFIAFLVTVGRDFLSGNFVAQSSLSLFILPITTASFTLSSIIFFRDYRYQNHRMLFYSSILAYILLFLAIGDRGPALSLILVLAALYAYYVKPVKPILFVPSILLGILTMSIIGSGRTSSNASYSEPNIISRGLENTDFSLEGFYDMTVDLVINVWTLYLGYGYTADNGINWGETWLKHILGVIPFAQRFVESAFGIKLVSSADIFTREALGPFSTWGLGTNLVSSVYIAFGFVGCILGFLTLGFSIELARSKLNYRNSVWLNICYFTLVSISIYYSRAEFLTPLKMIAWTYFIYLFLRTLKILRPLKTFIQ